MCCGNGSVAPQTVFSHSGRYSITVFPERKERSRSHMREAPLFLCFQGRRGPFTQPRAGRAYFFAELLVAEMISSCLAMNSFISA